MAMTTRRGPPGPAADDRAEPTTDEQPGAERSDDRPTDRTEAGERDPHDPVGAAEDDVLDPVAAWQRLTRGGEQQGE